MCKYSELVPCECLRIKLLYCCFLVILHETIRNDDFQRNAARQHCCDIVSNGDNIVPTYQRCRLCESSPVTSPLWNYDGAGGNGHVQKAIGLISKTTTLHMRHAFLYISLPSLHNYDVKWLKFRFTWERKRQGDKFYNPCLDSGEVPSLQLQPKFPSFN